MKKLILLLFVIYFVNANSQTYAKSYYPNTKIKVKLPGVVQVNDSLFCDVEEMNNIGYREFYYYIMHYVIFKVADLSNQTKQNNLKPDKLVFEDIDVFKGMPTYGNYWSHPAFSIYPIAGITYEQAILFSKWRTNIVFEQFLIKQKVIPQMYMNMQAFTIEDYFIGNFRDIKPDTNYLYYFEYNLPSKEEWNLVLLFSNYKNGEYKFPNHLTNPKQKFIDFPEYEYKKSKIKNLNNNVSEWLIDSNQYIGLNWRDSFDFKNIAKVRESNQPSATIGFQNIGKWKKWKY
jgi:hypothetical protein